MCAVYFPQSGREKFAFSAGPDPMETNLDKEANLDNKDTPDRTTDGNLNEDTPGKIRRAVALIKSVGTSVASKTRNLFFLRSLESPEAALAVQECLSGDSVLLDHEVAYVLGQMRQPNSADFLLRLAADRSANGIVRHEAIEALGNFRDRRLIPELRPFLEDAERIVAESAVLAIQKLSEDGEDGVRYGSLDPAYPYEGSFAEAAELFVRGSLAEKYKAMFYLRDLNTPEAVRVLARGFTDPSDLLRHEVAYVFGQMLNPHSVDSLIGVLEDASEREIVRHEAAEALGNIGTPKALASLQRYLGCDIRILRESAEVGLSIADHPDDYIEI